VQLLLVGERVILSGGYDFEPKWLHENSEYYGTLMEYIPGQNDAPAAVVHLDDEISVDGVTGSLLVLELRYRGAQWGSNNIVHIELCDFEPESIRWQDRRQGLWIESHATCRKLESEQSLTQQLARMS
jgi:hypothetical protein